MQVAYCYRVVCKYSTNIRLHVYIEKLRQQSSWWRSRIMVSGDDGQMESRCAEAPACKARPPRSDPATTSSCSNPIIAIVHLLTLSTKSSNCNNLTYYYDVKNFLWQAKSRIRKEKHWESTWCTGQIFQICVPEKVKIRPDLCPQIGQVFVLVPFGPRTVMTSREQLIFPQFFKPTSFVYQSIVPPGHCD